MANWSVATFAILIVTLLIVLTALILIIIQIVNPALLGTTATTTTVANLSAATAENGSAAILSVPAGGPSSADAFGPGTDGDLSLSNQTDIRLDKDAFYRNLTLDNCILETNGYRLFVAESLSMLHGTVIRNAGKNGTDNNRASPAAGGIGAAAGTLGGGGNGGNGLLSTDDVTASINGGSTVGGWNDPFLPANRGLGGSAVNLSGKRGGVGGKSNVGSSYRSAYEAAQALTPSFVPTVPLLGGGSGGGGGIGQKGYPGSGGGGGGGIVLIAAKNLIVSDSATIDVSGGSGGALNKNGPTLSGAASRYPPATATRGGGGGGGLIILSTLSDRTSYAGLQFVINGGQSSLFDGRLVNADAGQVVFWQDSDVGPSTAYVSLKQPASQSLKAGQETTVSFASADKRFGIDVDPAAGLVVVGKSGMYLLTATIELPPAESSSAVRAWIRLNQAKGIHPRIGEASGSIGGRLALSTVVALNAGDCFDLRIRAPTDVDLNASLDAPTELAAVLLAAT